MKREIDFSVKEKPVVQEAAIPANDVIKLKAEVLSKSELADFETCLKQLNGDNNQKISPDEIQSTATQVKKEELLKMLKLLSESEKIPVNITNIDEIKLFLRSREFSSSEEDEVKINLDNFEKKDIEFLKTCLENRSIILNPPNIQTNIAVQAPDGQISYKSFEVSKTLSALIEYSFKANKPIRVDFNENSSVILKMHNNGKLIAEFISNDKAMEYVLKSSIPGLKDKFDGEGIPYEKIAFKDNSKNDNKRQKQGGNQ